VRLIVLVLASSLVQTATTSASPNVALDDPRYDELAIYLARGLLPLYRGGNAQISESRMRKLLVRPSLPRGGWLRLDRALTRIALDADRRRSYSTPYLIRPVTGAISLACERNEGRPCVGTGTLGEFDVSGGVDDYVSGTLRLRGNIGSNGYSTDASIDRLYVNSTLGPLRFEIGRDVLSLGPRSRTSLGWSSHAVPLDQVRIASSAPLRLTKHLRGNALYAVARLRAPQTFPNSLLTVSRLQVDVADTIEVGLRTLLQPGGGGASSIGGPVGFFLEHLRRRDGSAGEADSSNRRFGGDVSWLIPEVHGVRVYYQVMFEDIRRARLIDAVRYDADHLFGVELAALGRHSVMAEYHQTGVRSHEHTIRMDGLTSGGRVGGSPLGPDAKSFYVGAGFELEALTLQPWIERASSASDHYVFEHRGAITLEEFGRKEFRTRIGSRARVRLRKGFYFEADTALEHVNNFGFQRGTTRWNGRIALDLVWRNPD